MQQKSNKLLLALHKIYFLQKFLLRLLNGEDHNVQSTAVLILNKL